MIYLLSNNPLLVNHLDRTFYDTMLRVQFTLFVFFFYAVSNSFNQKQKFTLNMQHDHVDTSFLFGQQSVDIGDGMTKPIHDS